MFTLRRGHASASLSGRWRRSALSLLAIVALFGIGLVTQRAATAAPPTVVSLTFDDGNADQMNAVPILQQAGMKGTFYIISGVVGAPNYLTLANLSTIAAAGNEIGGHTVTHPDLTTVPSDEVQRQVCDSRVALSNWGFRVTSFAYPYAALNANTETVVKNCGYNSARSLGDIKSAHSDPGVSALAGTVPPADPYNLASVDEIDSTWTLAQMESVVTTAERRGGWVPFTIHHVCPGSVTNCGDGLSISSTQLTSFLTWLKTRPTTTSVKTVDQVIGGTVKPLVSGPPATTTTTLANPSLETAGTPPFPQCWFPGGYGTNTPTWTRPNTGAHTGTYSQQLDLSGYSSGDAKLLPTFDLGSCSPAIAPGRTYTLGAWYKSSAVTQFALYYRNTAGAWAYWTSSPWFAAAPTTWTQATWTTPAAPADAAGISFGLNAFANGSLTTDDYSIVPVATAASAATAATAVGPTVAAARAAADASATPAGPTVAAARKAQPPDKGHPHHRHFSKNNRGYVPGGKSLRPGQRIAVPFLPD